MRVAPITLKLSTGASSGSMATGLTFGVINPDGSFGPLNLNQIYGYSIQAVYAGAAIGGTVKLQASIDGINFADIAGSEFTLSGAGTTVWNVSSSNYPLVRMVWTDGGSSVGTLSAAAWLRGF